MTVHAQPRSSQHTSKLVPPTHPGHWATSGISIKIRTIGFFVPPAIPWIRTGMARACGGVSSQHQRRVDWHQAEEGSPLVLLPRSCDASPDRGQTHAEQPETTVSSKLAGQRMVHTSARRAPAGSGISSTDQRPQRPAKRRRSQAP